MHKSQKVIYDTLLDKIRQMEKVLVAYSGGTDSSLLAKAALDALADKSIAVTIVSPSFPERERLESIAVAEEIGIEHVLIPGSEMEDKRYRKNDSDRCYYCKFNGLQDILNYGRRRGIANIIDGHNADDIGDHRPGHRAAAEFGVLSPLKELGINKDIVRELARELDLSNWDKPAAACLSSRIPYGASVNKEKLKQIEMAENYLKDLGIRQCRVRHFNEIAKIEIDNINIEIVLKNKNKIDNYFKSIGFIYTSLDLAEFRSGSMNQLLK